MVRARVDLDEVRLFVAGSNKDLSDGHHLAASGRAETTFCGATPAAGRVEPAFLTTAVDGYRRVAETDDDPEYDVWVARWAAERHDDLCGECGHVLRLALDHECRNHLKPDGQPEFLDETVYDPLVCAECGHRVEIVYNKSHAIDGSSYLPLDDVPDEDADVEFVGNV